MKLLKNASKHKASVNFYEYNSFEELPEIIQQLMNKAREATYAAYAPYSAFYVGAALLLSDGSIVAANNQENAAYPSGLCAERVAIFYASSQNPDMKVEAMALTARYPKKPLDEPVFPCGACRQVLIEYEHKQEQPITIFMMGETGKIIAFESVSRLLPFSFTSEDL